MRWQATLVLVLAVLLATGCSRFGGNENNQINEYAKYYTGKDGVVTRFEGLPSRLYYYGPNDNAGNEFSFNVEIHNEGASYSRGGIYVSGFDPTMLEFEEIPIIPQGACGITIGSIGLGEIFGSFQCDGIGITGVEGEGVTNVNIPSFADLINTFSGKQWWDPSKFDMSVDYNQGAGNGNFFSLSFNNIHANLEYFQNGRLLIAVLAGLDFRKNAGREFLLAPDNYDWPGGETEYLTYNGRIASWPPGLDQTQQSVLLTSCYLYTTFADPIMCIDPDPYTDVRKVCQPRSRTWNGGNGAPVAITSIEQENTPRKIIFRINVANVGSGTVWDAGALEKCSPYYPGRVSQRDKNIVYLGDVRIGEVGLVGRGGREGIVCYPEIIRLDPGSGKGSTTCTYPIEYINLKSAYQTPLTVEIWYGYSQTQQRQITIKRVI